MIGRLLVPVIKTNDCSRTDRVRWLRVRHPLSQATQLKSGDGRGVPVSQFHAHRWGGSSCPKPSLLVPWPCTLPCSGLQDSFPTERRAGQTVP